MRKYCNFKETIRGEVELLNARGQIGCRLQVPSRVTPVPKQELIARKIGTITTQYLTTPIAETKEQEKV